MKPVEGSFHPTTRRSALKTSPPTSFIVNVNGVRLHTLDWGGSGTPLLFLSGMGCSVYIFDKFAARFTDKFHVLAMDRRGHGDSDYPESGYDQDTLAEDLRQFLDALKIDKVILAGHSMAYLELTRFAVMHPERVLKLVFLDAAYDNSSPEYKAVMAKNPLGRINPPWPENDRLTMDEYLAAIPRDFPAMAAVWSPEMELQTRHTLSTNPEGKVADRMTEAIFKGISDTFAGYTPEYPLIHPPVLSFFALQDGAYYLSPETQTEEQKKQILDWFGKDRIPYLEKHIEHFRQQLPHARIVEIPHGHHYCFIKHEEIVFNEMRKFLLEE
jgi:non-heme chloroperoxidase